MRVISIVRTRCNTVYLRPIKASLGGLSQTRFSMFSQGQIVEVFVLKP